jgi:predicted 3-demethylubiquinone-9 3-methyltransferase (glyoxalase superfamily)
VTEHRSERQDREAITSQCGWLKDKFGLSWQVIPSALFRLMQDPDPAKSKRVMEAMLKMRKIDIARLEQAYSEK